MAENNSIKCKTDTIGFLLIIMNIPANTHITIIISKNKVRNPKEKSLIDNKWDIIIFEKFFIRELKIPLYELNVKNPLGI
jgi:hypothetical protein